MYKPQNRMNGPGVNSGLWDRAKTAADEALIRTDDLVREHPASSALLTFTFGCCLGITTALLLLPKRRPHHWYEGRLPAWASSSNLSEALESAPRKVRKYLARR